MEPLKAVIIYYLMKIDHSRKSLAILVKTSFCFLLISGSGILNANPETLFQLINDRLSYMEDVALYKKENSIAVEDLAREQLVIANAVSAAEAKGLQGDSISGFFRNQIEVAKAIQYRSLANWISEPATKVAPDLIIEIRPALTELGDQIVAEFAQYLEDEFVIEEAHRALFHQSIALANISDADKDLLFDSIKLVRRQ